MLQVISYNNINNNKQVIIFNKNMIQIYFWNEIKKSHNLFGV